MSVDSIVEDCTTSAVTTANILPTPITRLAGRPDARRTRFYTPGANYSLVSPISIKLPSAPGEGQLHLVQHRVKIDAHRREARRASLDQHRG